MTLQGYVDEIKLKLTAGVLKLEISDATIAACVNSALREIQRYISSTKLITIPFEPCIDLTNYKVSSVSSVMRAEGNLYSAKAGRGTVDPVYMSIIQNMANPNGAHGLTDFVYNFGAFNSALQIQNTLSTDLLFRFDKSTSKLYINCTFNMPSKITIEYIPRYDSVEEITSDYWQDVLFRLSLGLTREILGELRTRYVQSGALFTQDGESMLAQGRAEVSEIREKLEKYHNLIYGID